MCDNRKKKVRYKRSYKKKELSIFYSQKKAVTDAGEHQNDSLKCLVLKTKLRKVCVQFAADLIKLVSIQTERLPQFINSFQR